MRKFFLLVIFFHSAFVLALDDFPTEKQIQEWLKKNGDNAEIYTHNKASIMTIFLKNHEKAYLAPVALNDQGRNGMYRTALIRSAIGEAKVLPSYIKEVNGVYDFNNDQVSELDVSEIYSGQGTMEGTKAIVNLDGWEFIKLLERRVKSNNGMYLSKQKEYFDDQCIWEFNQPKGSFEIELHETCTQTKGATLDPPKKAEETYRIEKGVLKPKSTSTESEIGK